jgi:glycosyltransferase involved in cell wall biosynthesis
MREKIGIGIVTCDRPNYLNDLLASIDTDKVDEIVVVDDGNKPAEFDKDKYTLFKTSGRIGVGKAKNIAIKHLMGKKCPHIFILEDDCIITNNDVFKKYIQAAKTTGLKHFNFGPASPWNRVQKNPEIIGDLSKRGEASQLGEANPKLVVRYNEDVSISLFEHIVAMFTYYHISTLEKVGLMDEDFYNAWEHVEHTLRIINNGDYTPFWAFADITGAEDYIKEQENEKANTSLAKNEEEFMKRVHDGLNIFYKKHNTVPSMIAPTSNDKIKTILKEIYGRNKNN